MPLNFNNLKFVVGNAKIVEQMPTIPSFRPFSEQTISFLNALSKKIMISGKLFSDVITFGFWCRQASMLKEKGKYDDISERLGRGIVFHSTPSNVAVNFAFSFVAGLLAGNANIVRLPAKDFEQVKIICDAINELLNDSYKHMAPYICMVKYPSQKEISDFFSSICDSRIIWGGDKTIENMRRSPLTARANEITFADRYSIAVINADEYLNTENKSKIAQDFYNDTYFSDQNACTSPKVIIWLGHNINNAKKEFWCNLYEQVADKYSLAAVQSVGKLNAFYKVAANHEVQLIKNTDNLITRVAVKKLDNTIMDFSYNSGFFFEYDAKNLKEILPLCSSRCQTMIYLGINKNELEQFFKEYGPHGIDRVVPIGNSMDFSLIWDGYDLVRNLSREITIL